MAKKTKKSGSKKRGMSNKERLAFYRSLEEWVSGTASDE
jgi:hypothetical protein